LSPECAQSTNDNLENALNGQGPLLHAVLASASYQGDPGNYFGCTEAGIFRFFLPYDLYYYSLQALLSQILNYVLLN
jgi:hypothetical protein